MTTQYTQDDYVIRYPDGREQVVTAHQIKHSHDGIITLKKAPGDNPGNIVFMATPASGVTVTQIKNNG